MSSLKIKPSSSSELKKHVKIKIKTSKSKKKSKMETSSSPKSNKKSKMEISSSPKSNKVESYSSTKLFKSKKVELDSKVNISLTSKTGYIDLSQFKESIFKNYLLNKLNKNKYATIILNIPDFISSTQKDKYLFGLKNYLSACAKEEKNWTTSTEEDFYYMAVIAYNYRDIVPLVRIHKLIKKIKSDKYYWLYLSRQEELFYPTLEIEMYRRKTTSTINILPLLHYPFAFEQANKNNIVSLISKSRSEILSSQVRIFPANLHCVPQYVKEMEKEWSRLMANINSNLTFDDVLSFYQSEVPGICNSILQIGGIIAGGFVNSLVNATYFLDEISIDNINYDDEDFIRSEDDYFAFEKGKTHYAERRRQDKTLVVIPGFQECVRVFFARKNYGNEDISEETGNNIRKDRLNYVDYDLEGELKRLNKHLLVVDNKIYQIIYNHSTDIDIFITGDDYLDKTNRIIDVLVNKLNLRGKVYFGQFATTFDFGHCIPKIQLIKRKYLNVEEILAGFDIDPSRVAMIWSNSQRSIVATQSYINAVNYGINLIVPSRQSETFNFRLAKYYNKGYEPYLPANLIRTIAKGHSSTHSYQELLHYKNKEYEWTPSNRSDYDKLKITDLTDKFVGTNNPSDNWLEERKVQIIDEELEPGMLDLLYLCGKLIESYTKYNLISLNAVRVLSKYITSLFWKIVEPGSQITSSFNPTSIDYLGSNKESSKKITDVYKKKKEKLQKEKVEEQKIISNLIGQYLPQPLTIISSSYYVRYIHEIYNNVLKIELVNKESPLLLNNLLAEFNGTGIQVILEEKKEIYDDSDDSEQKVIIHEDFIKFYKQVGVDKKSEQNKLREALETWDSAGQQPYLALQEDGYYDFFMDILSRQKLHLDGHLYRGTVRHSELKEGGTFEYPYPSSWSTSEDQATAFGTVGDPESILLVFESNKDVKGIHNPFNSNNEDEVILYPMNLVVTKRNTKKGKTILFVTIKTIFKKNSS